MDLIELDIYGIGPSQVAGSYSLILAEVDGERKLPVIVGTNEAQSIAVFLEGIKTEFPLTHDLFSNSLELFQIKVEKVVIEKLVEGVFHTQIYFETNGELKSIKSRTSDAIAMAIRQDAPIFTTSLILETAGLNFEEKNIEKPGRDNSEQISEVQKINPQDSLTSKTIEELETMLDAALSKEDYMKAAVIRDELDKRK